MTSLTTISSHMPSPELRVSWICESIPSRSVLSRMPAIPPCAQLVEESFNRCFVITVTLLSASAIFNAANKPAMPLPMIIISAILCPSIQSWGRLHLSILSDITISKYRVASTWA